MRVQLRDVFHVQLAFRRINDKAQGESSEMESPVVELYLVFLNSMRISIAEVFFLPFWILFLSILGNPAIIKKIISNFHDDIFQF